MTQSDEHQPEPEARPPEAPRCEGGGGGVTIGILRGMGKGALPPPKIG